MPLDLPEIYDSNRITPSPIPQYEGFVGKYLKSPWDSFKSKLGKAWEWTKTNKANIMATAGGAVQAAGVITGNPGLYIAGNGLMKGAEAIKEGDAKTAIEKVIAERTPNPYSNRNIAYSDFPRIHYSRKPAALKTSQNKDKKKKEPKQKQKQNSNLPPSRKTDPGFWADLRAATKKYNERHEKAYKEFESGDW